MLSVLRKAYAVKATSATRQIREFKDEAQDIVDSFLSGDLSKTKALNAFMRLIDGSWIDVSEQAWADGGRDLGDLSSSRLTEQLSAMRDHAREMFNTLAERRDKAIEAGESTDGLGDNNAQLWANNLAGQYNSWRLDAAAGSKELLQWTLGATENHCEGHLSCLELAAGPPHTAEWFQRRGLTPGMAGSATPCGGFRCGCYFTDVAGHDVGISSDDI